MKKYRWTEQDDDCVRVMYDGTGKSVECIAAQLGLRPRQVKSHIQFMGLAKRTGHARWNPQDDDVLREMIGKYKPNTIARKLHRSITAVRIRAIRLGLSYRNRDGWYTKKEACEILGVNHKRCQSWIDNGILKARCDGERQPQQNSLAMWHIDEQDLVAFIKKYPQELNGRNVDIVQIVGLLTDGHFGS